MAVFLSVGGNRVFEQWMASGLSVLLASPSSKQSCPSNTRPFRYNLNQIPYEYTVEVRNRFKGLDLIDTVPDELWTEVHNIVQEVVIKTIPKKKKCKKGKMIV